jgi:hypothetical protein
MTQSLFWAPTIFKIMVLCGVIAGAFSQRYYAQKIGLSVAGSGTHNYENWLFNNLNFLIFLCTNFLYITTSRGLTLSLPDFHAKQDYKIALAILAGPLTNLVCASLAITAAMLIPAVTTAAQFFAISQIMAALFTLMPFPPASGHYLLTLACPQHYRHYFIEQTPTFPRWERHVHFIVLWLAASSPTGQLALHSMLYSTFQTLNFCAPLLLLGAGAAALSTTVSSWRSSKLTKVSGQGVTGKTSAAFYKNSDANPSPLNRNEMRQSWIDRFSSPTGKQPRS